ncbi:MAG: single-stranded-DNA-specific exonuclease RecJ, partial [Terriglobia bacterium]
MRWVIPQVQDELVRFISNQLGVSTLLARLLVLRGADTPEAADRFLNPHLSQLHDPFLMAGMEAAVGRLRRAVDRQEKILIYGDYDVDGTTAVVTLLTALRSLGAEAAVHVPHRLAEGYGMRAGVMEWAAAEGFSLAVSVDTGIREHEAVDCARERGIDCIITDHHLPEGRLPAAHAVLNPRRPDCAYPDKNLSGAGVCLKLVQALLGSRLSERLLRSYLKIVAIGAIADVVPLVGENRVISSLGLAALSEVLPATQNAVAGRRGLNALLSAAGLAGKNITAADVAFRIAPRLNAAGRMDHAKEVIALFTAQDGDAVAIAQHLETLNRERQEVEERILNEVLAEIDRRPEMAERRILVFSGQGWHRGVIGIVASRLVERFHRPALVVAVEDEVGYGSGRSISCYHLLNALDQAAPLFGRYGGHAQAAGFSLPAARIEELAGVLERHARTVLTEQDLEPVLRVDLEVNLAEINWATLAELKKLEPCGFGNPKPVFSAIGEIELPPRVMKEKHLKFRVADHGRSMDAVGWNLASRCSHFKPGQALGLAFSVEENTFLDQTSLQLVLRDIREAEA